jgi:hypothetical protein
LSFIRSVSRTQSGTALTAGNEAAPAGPRIAGDRARVALPKAVSAAEHVRRCEHLPDASLSHAIDLVQALAAVECICTVGGPAAVPADLLRDVVLITARLTGPSWLEANADFSPAADFAALRAAGHRPVLPELDGILAALLWYRFVGTASGGDG